MVTFDESFESPKKMVEYLESLPDVTEDELYRISIHTTDAVYYHDLLMPHDDEQALAEFDLTFLSAHNAEQFGEAEYMCLLAPVGADGERREIARLEMCFA